jgi:3'(2'), 5'-bisphosphate nucleotidase
MTTSAVGDLDAEALTLAIRDLAVAAGEKILAIYNTDFSVDRKQDKSPVTAADGAAEAIILAG